MIELTSVTKRYGSRGTPPAVANITLTVPAGSTWAVVGPNGAGKSTLLSLVLGFNRPTSGEVSVDGDTPRAYLRTQGASYLPERFRVPRGWPVRDVLRMLARLHRVPAATADQALERLGLEDHAERPAGELSRGLLQRVGLAQALLAPRRLTVLDEPTEGLDPVWRVRLRDIVAELRAGGATILIASHDLGEVERLADRAVLLQGGAVRNVIDTRDDAAPASYRLVLAAPSDSVPEAFPSVRPLEENSYEVSVADARELSQRLGALLALGAVVQALEPLRRPLEERVRDALGDGPANAPAEDA